MLKAQELSRAECVDLCRRGSSRCFGFKNAATAETVNPYIEMIEKAKKNSSGSFFKDKCNLNATINKSKIVFYGQSCLISQKIPGWDYLFETHFASDFEGTITKILDEEFVITFTESGRPNYSALQGDFKISSGPVKFVTNYKDPNGAEYILWHDGFLCHQSPYL